MGRVKAKLMEYEEKISFLENTLNFLKTREPETSYIRPITYRLQNIVNKAYGLDNSSFDVIYTISELIPEDLIRKLSTLVDSLKDNSIIKNTDIELIRNILEDLNRINVSIEKLRSNSIHSYNSEKYYKELIQAIKKEKESLEKTLNSTQGENEKQRVIYERRIQQKELELQNVRNQLEEKKKQDNAIEEWKKKITETFEELKSHLTPIKNEHKRLKQMFKTYAVLSCFIFIVIAVLEIIICIKFHQCQNLPEWKDFFVLFLPIPLTGGLLWAFITQMNRAQRQLIILANQIHEIEYIEGILISINSLSVDINDSIKRINLAIEKLLENHLHLNHTKSNYNEESIVKEENKDMVPTDLIIKILKELKSVSPK